MEKPDYLKLSHTAVDYQERSRHFGQRCHNCVHFIKANPPRCEGVKSPIAPGAWCKRWKKKKG